MTPNDTQPTQAATIDAVDAAVETASGTCCGCGGADGGGGAGGCGCAGGGMAFDNAPLDAILERYRGYEGGLIPVLQETQETYGYLPQPAIARIAKAMRRPAAQVYGVATFYAQFHLKPRGKHIIRVCLGTACHVRGGERILEQLSSALGVQPGETTGDLQFTLERVACIGACGLAPTIMVDDDTHGRLTPASAVKVVEGYREA